MSASGGFDQLSRHPHAVGDLAHAAFQDIANTEFAADVLDRGGPPFIGEARVAGDDEQRTRFRQIRDDVLGQTVGKEFLPVSLLMLVNARTAIEGLLGSASSDGSLGGDTVAFAAVASSSTR